MLPSPFYSVDSSIVASDGAAGDLFGTVVRIDGRWLMAAAPNKDNGAVYAFAYANGSWTEQQALTGSDSGSGDNFGTAAALDASWAAFGAPPHNSGAGAVYVFQLGNINLDSATGAPGTWSQVS